MNSRFSAYIPQKSRIFRVAREGGWIVLGQVTSVISSLILVRVLTGRLEPDQYGKLSLGLTVAGFINQMVMGGINNGIVRFYSVASDKNDLIAYFNASKKLMVYASLVVVAIATVLLCGLQLFGYVRWVWISAAALVFSIVSAYNSMLGGIQNAARQRAKSAFHGQLDIWLKIALTAAVVFWVSKTSTGVIVAYAISALVVTIFRYIFVRKDIIRNHSSNIEHEKYAEQIWKYSLPFYSWGIFTWAQTSSDRWALKTFSNSQDVGLYAAVFQLGYGPISIALGFTMALLEPIFYQRAGDATNPSRNENVHRLVWKITVLCLIMTICAFLVALLLHEFIFLHFVGIKFRSVSYLLPWIALASGLFATGQMLSIKLLSEMRASAMTKAKIGTAILGVLFNGFGAYFAGKNGVVGALVAFSVVYFLWMALLSFKRNSGIQTEESTC